MSRRDLQGTRTQSGFTLIELSIVLVIIGLIVGGILVGQDMIKSATVRSVVRQVGSYNTAINTFRDKYGALPGDAQPSKVTQFNLPAGAGGIRTGAAGLGDGDSIYNACALNQRALGCETAWLWNDLSFAQLVPDALNNTTNAPIATVPGVTIAQAPSWLPETRLRDNAFLGVYSLNGRNFFYLAQLTSVAAATTYTAANAVTVREASDIDAKTDDGSPLTGGVRAQSAPGTDATAATAAAGVCVATGPSYNTANSGNFLEEMNCQLSMRLQ